MTDGGLRKRRRPDPSLPRDTVRDTSISFRALGALLWIMDKPDGWSIRSDHMAKDGKRSDGTSANGRPHRREGRGAIRTALLEELAAEGYYRLERRRMRDGSVKMGTAASEDRVDSWANQHKIFGRSPVPMLEQPDGTFLVQYPDGSTGPDDCDPPEMPNLEDTSPDVDESPGHTGDQKPVSGESPETENPAPVNPATGDAATGNRSPLSTKNKEKGSSDREAPPTPHSDPAADDDREAATEGGSSRGFDEQTQALLAGAVSAAVTARSAAVGKARAWTRESVRKAMEAALDGGRAPDEVAWAIVYAAKDTSSSVPGRIKNDAWWDEAMRERFVPGPAPRDVRQCKVHKGYPADNCGCCRIDAKIAEREKAEREAAETAETATEAAESATVCDEATVSV